MSVIKKAKSLSLRTQSGSLMAIIPVLILIAIIGIGAFAMDISHNVSVRTELQNATDAAALSGARDLLQDSTMNNTDNDVLSVAADNTADGEQVSPSNPGFTLTDTYSFDNAANNGTVTVDASKQVNNLFSKIFGHATDTVNAHSVAQAWRSVTGIYANQAFPLMVSLDTTMGGQPALYTMQIGDQYTFYINSQQYKNAAWTGLTLQNTNANFLKNATDMLLGFQPMQAGYIPAVNVNDSLSLGNGTTVEKSLAQAQYMSVLTSPNFNIVLPCMLGDPPYNQSRTCVGFITFHITNIVVDQAGGKVMAITGNIVKGVVKGPGGIPASTGNGAENAGMTNISAGTVKLVS